MNNFRYKLFSYTCLDDRVWFDSPNWTDIEKRLLPVIYAGGSVTIDLQQPMPGQVSALSLCADKGKFLLIATMRGESRDRVIRWREPDGALERGVIDIAGDEWDARSVVSDPSIAIRVFKEVFDTGKLSADSLQNMR